MTLARGFFTTATHGIGNVIHQGIQARANKIEQMMTMKDQKNEMCSKKNKTTKKKQENENKKQNKTVGKRKKVMPPPKRVDRMDKKTEQNLFSFPNFRDGNHVSK